MFPQVFSVAASGVFFVAAKVFFVPGNAVKVFVVPGNCDPACPLVVGGAFIWPAMKHTCRASREKLLRP